MNALGSLTNKLQEELEKREMEGKYNLKEIKNALQ